MSSVTLYKEDIHSEILKRFLYHYSGLCHLCFQNSVHCSIPRWCMATLPWIFHNFYFSPISNSLSWIIDRFMLISPWLAPAHHWSSLQREILDTILKMTPDNMNHHSVKTSFTILQLGSIRWRLQVRCVLRCWCHPPPLSSEITSHPRAHLWPTTNQNTS